MTKQLNKKELEQKRKEADRISKELENEMTQKRRIFLEATRNILENEIKTGRGHVFYRRARR